MSAVVTQAVELLPCPFCGGEAELEEVMRGSAEGSRYDYWQGLCLSCEGTVPAPSEAEAITAWNQRHRSEAVEELVEVLGSLVEEFGCSLELLERNGPSLTCADGEFIHSAVLTDRAELLASAAAVLSKHRGEQG